MWSKAVWDIWQIDWEASCRTPLSQWHTHTSSRWSKIASRYSSNLATSGAALRKADLLSPTVKKSARWRTSIPWGKIPSLPTFSWKAALPARRTWTSRSKRDCRTSCVASRLAKGLTWLEENALPNDHKTKAAASRTPEPMLWTPLRCSKCKARITHSIKHSRREIGKHFWRRNSAHARQAPCQV